MKKIWLIIGGIVLLILVLGGAWWYLLMNGRPESLSGIPNPFGSFSGSSTFEPPQSTQEASFEEVVGTGKLRKISNTPIAGSIIFDQDSVPKVRYVERGTGHIFEVDVSTGTSIRLMNTTIPRATEAIWSPRGNRVVVITEETPSSLQIFINTLEKNDAGETTMTSIELPRTARSIAFGTEGDILYYLAPTSAGSTGYRYDLKTNTRVELFNSILRDITVLWEPTIRVYTTASAQAVGYAYTGTSFERFAGGVLSLMLTPTKSSFVTTFLNSSGTLSSYGTTPTSTPLAVSTLPEKCTFSTSRDEMIWCGAPISPISGQYPDLWYQGITSFEDMVWEINVHTGSARLISIPTEDVGESIDVIDMHVNASSTMLIFTNKRDGLLWLQELPQNTVPDDAPAQNVEQTNEEE